MPALDLDALLASDAQGAKRDVKDAITSPSRHVPDLEASSARDAKLLAMLRRAVKLADSEDLVGAARTALKAVELEPDVSVANQVMGLVLERMGRLSQAIEFYERALGLDPSESNIYYNLGLIAWKLDMLEGAERFYRITLDLDPSSDEAIINLAGVLRDQGRFADSIEILRTAIYRKPEDPLFWNSLGTTLLEAGDPAQAITFYEETLRLDPEFGRAWHNLGYAQCLVGDPAISTASSDKALEFVKSAQDRAEMIYSRGMSRLASGDIVEGWKDYAIRLHDDYANATLFLVRRPRWEPDEPLTDKRLLLIGEQGVGDEVLFLNTAPDVIDEIGPGGHLTIACESRLIPLIARSFPDASVVAHGTTRQEGRTIRIVPSIKDGKEIDVWCPMGAPLMRYRKSIDAFPDRAAYLTPDPARVESLRAQLAELPAGVKVGLCWKSKLMTAKRAKFFSPFEEWKSVLATPGAVFVSLQYGEVDEEIALAAQDYGVTIHQLAGLDIMNDLDGVAALGAALDLSLGPKNASTNLAAACGGEVWFLSQKIDWPLLGTDRMPWYPRSRTFWPERYGEWGVAMDRLASALSTFTETRKAA